MKIIKQRIKFDNCIFDQVHDDYICSFEIRGYLVNAYLDDYGQQYFIRYTDGDSVSEIGLGSYNMELIESIICEFDPKGYEITMFGEDSWNQILQTRKDRNLFVDDYNDFEIYDIEALYKELKGE